ncbi:MAG: CNNM domain-containing protein [Bdellovibrionota bacterium]
MVYIVIIGCCITLNACLSAFEMGLVSIKRASLKLLVDKGSKQAVELQQMRDNLERTLSTIQVGITIVAIISGVMAGELTEQYGGPLLIALGIRPSWAGPMSTTMFVVLVTFVTVVFGELIPKSIAAKYPINVAFFFLKLIKALNVSFLPLIRVFEGTTIVFLKMFKRLGFKTKRQDLHEANNAFAIHKLSRVHREYVFNLVNLQKIPLDSVLLEWDKVVKIDLKMASVEVRDIIIGCGHTRVPVMEGDLIKGLLNAKEFLASSSEKWQNLVRPIIQVNETARPLNVFRMMQAKRSHICIVVSKANKSPLGIVTIEDILEEVVGEIYDEDDELSVDI